MDLSESLANEHLLHRGFRNIVFEPDGNVPPDFLVDKRIAIEVRRLNQNELTKSGFRGREESVIPFETKVAKLIASLGYSDFGVSWFVFHTLKGPVPVWAKFEPKLRKYLVEFKNDLRNQIAQTVEIGDAVEIRMLRASEPRTAFFLLGGFSDHKSGGWVLAETQKNLRICISEKTAKVARVRYRYPEWWLIFVDYIGYGVDDCDQEQFRKHLNVKHNWDKVVLLNPLNPRSAFELP